MGILETIIAIFVALGARELIALLVNFRLNRTKNKAETDAMHLANAGTELKDIREAIQLVGEMRREMEQDKAIIAALKNDKIEDDRKIARRDGVIEEQRVEIKNLHNDITQLQIEGREKARQITNLESRVTSLEGQNAEIVKENLQLKGMVEKREQ